MDLIFNYVMELVMNLLRDVGKDEPAKIIRAKNGDIHIDAMVGDIVLKGMNIRIVLFRSIRRMYYNCLVNRLHKSLQLHLFLQPK